ncbi:MAG: DNA repair protein RecN [Saprospiraceae bacterium]|nr:DNA repair protein RecN [Saprospiraceae bacterium]
MLKHLSIKNYALIDELEIDFSDGLSIITGETGAGKSILLGALSLILGNRADTKVLLNKNRKCIVEGSFNIYNYNLESFFKQNELDFEQSTLLRREINSQGKSRAFINDTPVNLNVLKELGNMLVDVHSQHTTLALNNSNFHLAIIDNFVKHQNLLSAYNHDFKEFLKNKKALNELLIAEKKSNADKDYFQFLFDEINEANLIENEQHEIETELEILNNAEEIKSKLFAATTALSQSENNLIKQFAEIKNLVNQVSNYHPNINEVYKRFASSLIEIDDIASEIEKIEEGVNFNPERLESLNSRLDLIYKLQQKHRVETIKELIDIREKLDDDLSKISSLDNKISNLKNEIEKQEINLNKSAIEISKNRKSAFPIIEKRLTLLLSELGMPDAQLKIHHEYLENFTADGKDKVSFLFNANKGGRLDEISGIASGGELSRLMLSIKSLISTNSLLPTIIFDEIDAGVSGDIAGKVGNILKSMSEKMQVIAITHIPQIAGKGSEHFYVYKESDKETTKTLIKKLNKDERVLEIAKMLSGENVSNAATETARELLSEN